jgi:hypothetical protein
MQKLSRKSLAIGGSEAEAKGVETRTIQGRATRSLMENERKLLGKPLGWSGAEEHAEVVHVVARKLDCARSGGWAVPEGGSNHHDEVRIGRNRDHGFHALPAAGFAEGIRVFGGIG